MAMSTTSSEPPLAAYTDRGLAEMASGIREARRLVDDRANAASAKLAAADIEQSAMRKIGAALDAALEIIAMDRRRREAAAKAIAEATP